MTYKGRGTRCLQVTGSHGQSRGAGINRMADLGGEFCKLAVGFSVNSREAILWKVVKDGLPSGVTSAPNTMTMAT